MPSLVLLGDSILDNASYTHPEPDTAAHLRRLLGAGWQVDLLARDGAVMAGIPAQLELLRTVPDWAVLSIGGNDATAHAELLARPARSSAEIMEALVELGDDFAERYGRVLGALRGRVRRLLVCTIYEAPLEPEPFARLARAPLAVLNDRIVRLATAAGHDVLELRAVCTSRADYVLQIEPSALGARRIAEAIAGVVAGAEHAARGGRVLAPRPGRDHAP